MLKGGFRRSGYECFYLDSGIAASQGLEQAGPGQAFDGGNYYVVGWQGQKYVALNGKVDKLTSLVLEQNSTDYKILAVNESWSIGNNYTLELKSIDAKAFPHQALLELTNESGKVDDKVIQEGQVYTYVAGSIAGENNVPLFVTYVDNVTEIQFD